MPVPPLLGRLFDAGLRPAHLVPAGVGAMAAGGLVAAGLPPLALAVGALSLGTWGALVAWELVSPRPEPEPEPEPAPPPRLASPDLDRLLRGVQAAAARIEARIDGHDGVLGGSLLEVRAECTELATVAEEAARRGDAAWKLLSTLDANAIAREAEARRDAARRAADAEVARALGNAADSKKRELTSWRELRGLVDRVGAELIAAEAGLDELHARVVRLTLEDPGDPSAGGVEVGRQLKELRDRLHVVERSAAQTLKEVG